MRIPYFLRMPDNRQSHHISLAKKWCSAWEDSPSLWLDVQPQEGHMQNAEEGPSYLVSWLDQQNQPVQPARCLVTSHPRQLCTKARVPYLPSLCSWPCLDVSSQGLRHTVISNPFHLHQTVPWLYHVNPHDLRSWPPDFGLHLLWEALFQLSNWLPIGKRLASPLPVLWLRCSWRNTSIFDSCCWHCQQSLLLSGQHYSCLHAA